MSTTDDVSVTDRTVPVNGIDMHIVEAGAGPLVILCHGFPELSFSWRHQITGLAAAGYHVVAPDQRGYGRTTRPDAIEDYDIIHLTDDLLALLDELGEDKAVFVGHDWGSMVVSTLALRAPERLAGVVAMSVPFLPRGPMEPVAMMRQLFGDSMFFYMLYFQEPGVADADLARDPAMMMRRMLAGLSFDTDAIQLGAMLAPNDGRGFVERLPEPDGLPDWLPQADLDHYIEEFTRTGFTGGINWYRNLDRNWKLTEDLAGATFKPPALFIAGAGDAVLNMTPLAVMDDLLDDPRGRVLIENAGHWVQQEKPEEVNAALLEFLAGVY